MLSLHLIKIKCILKKFYCMRRMHKPSKYAIKSMIIHCIVVLMCMKGILSRSIESIKPEETLFYSKIREITDQIDELIENNRASSTVEENMIKSETYFNFLKKNNITQIYDGPMSTVYKYSGDLMDLLDVPFIAENINDKMHKYILLKRGISTIQLKNDELGISLRMNHPNLILSYFGYKRTDLKSFTDIGKHVSWIASEFLEVNVNKVAKNIASPLTEQIIAQIMKDVTKGLEYMHSLNVVHLDIKEENIMGTYSKKQNQTIYKLIDFGVSLVIDDPEKKAVFLEGFAVGTDPLRPPEIINHSLHGYASDVWCLGFLGIYLSMPRQQGKSFIDYIETDQFKVSSFGKSIKIDQNNNGKIYQDFLDGNIRKVIDPRTPYLLADFISQCSDRNYETRSTLKKLLNHPYLCGMSVPTPSSMKGSSFEKYLY